MHHLAPRSSVVARVKLVERDVHPFGVGVHKCVWNTNLRFAVIALPQGLVPRRLMVTVVCRQRRLLRMVLEDLMSSINAVSVLPDHSLAHSCVVISSHSRLPADDATGILKMILGHGASSRPAWRHAELSLQVKQAVECVHHNLFDPQLSVKTLKTRCKIRDNNVSCHFKCETGIYLHSYIAMLRLETAVILLHDPHLSIAEVADRVGYRHLQTFYRVFRRFFRCNPGSFRSMVSRDITA
jgi:AraC-like DNA-binding protein